MAVYLKVTKVLIQAGTFKPITIEAELPKDLSIKLDVDMQQLKSGANFVKASDLVEQLLKAVQLAEEAVGEPRTANGDYFIPAKQIDEANEKPAKKESKPVKKSSLADDDDEDEPIKKPTKKSALADDDEDEEDDTKKKSSKKNPADDDDDDNEEDDDDDEEEDEPPAKKGKKTKKASDDEGLEGLKKFLAEDD